MLIVRKNILFNQTYAVCKYSTNGAFIGIVSGMGRNRGTWDSQHSKRTAQRYAALLRKEDKGHMFKVEETQ